MKMKSLLAYAPLSFLLLYTNTNAQVVTPASGSPVVKANKGHFLFGTNLINYTNGGMVDRTFSAGKPVDTLKETFNSFSAGLNVWAGYFLSDKVCVGLSFGVNQGYSLYAFPYSANIYYAYSPFAGLIPSSLFFRYYLFQGDSNAHINVYLEGIVGGAYSSGNYTSDNGNGRPVTQTVQVNEFNVNGNVSAVLSFDISRHFSVPVKLGFLYSYYEQDSPAYQYNNGNYNQSEPASKETLSSPSFIGSIGLQYKL